MYLDRVTEKATWRHRVDLSIVQQTAGLGIFENSMKIRTWTDPYLFEVIYKVIKIMYQKVLCWSSTGQGFPRFYQYRFWENCVIFWCTSNQLLWLHKHAWKLTYLFLFVQKLREGRGLKWQPVYYVWLFKRIILNSIIVDSFSCAGP